MKHPRTNEVPTEPAPYQHQYSTNDRLPIKTIHWHGCCCCCCCCC